MLRIRHCTAALILTYIILIKCPIDTFAGSFLSTQQIIKYNDSNYVQFKDKGRKESKNGIHFGTAISFIWTKDGKNSVIGPFDTLGTTTPIVMASRITKIFYKNPTQIWVLSELGHRFSGAALVDLKKGSVINDYNGVGFTLSPDLQDISYVYTDKFLGDMVFINDTMVWPELIPGFSETGTIYPETKNGTTAGEIAERSQRRNYFINFQDFKWQDKNNLKFSIRPMPSDGRRNSEEIDWSQSEIEKFVATKSMSPLNATSTVTLHRISESRTTGTRAEQDL